MRGQRPTSWSWMLLWPVCAILRGTPALGALAVSRLGTSLLPGPFFYHDPRGVISVDLSSPAQGASPPLSVFSSPWLHLIFPMFPWPLGRDLSQQGLLTPCVASLWVGLGSRAHWGFPDGAAVKNLPAMQDSQEMPVRFLGQEDLLEEEMATHSSILAWRTPWTEKPGGLQSLASQRVGHD